MGKIRYDDVAGWLPEERGQKAAELAANLAFADVLAKWVGFPLAILGFTLILGDAISRSATGAPWRSGSAAAYGVYTIAGLLIALALLNLLSVPRWAAEKEILDQVSARG